MAHQFKMALVLLVAVQLVVVLGRKKEETGDDDSLSSADSMETGFTAQGHRRSNPPQWQYEGLPIEYQEHDPHSRTSYRRHHQRIQPTTTTTTTAAPPVFPPLSPRFRRIFNADETARIEQHRFMAAVLVNKELWCGGALIRADRVITAAHCLQLQYNNRFFREYVRMLSVRVGSSNATAGGELLHVTEIFFHPNYKPGTLAFNFAVVGLHKNVTKGKTAVVEVSRNRIIPNDNTVTFLGWGSVLDGTGKGGQVLLQKLDLPIYGLGDCQEVYGKELVTKNNFCAGFISKRKNVCNHDGGGPAILDGKLVGILSFSSKRCDEPDKPAVFSIMGAAAEWLDDIAEVASKKEPEKPREWVNIVE